MGLRLPTLDDDARYDTWARVIARIRDEHHHHAWGHYMFRLLRAVFTTNERLSEEGGFIFEWAVDNYVDATLMLLRRELDRQDGTENLRNLLFDMIDHPTVVSRGRYLARWDADRPWHRELANEQFGGDGFIVVQGQPDADHLDPAAIKADLERLITGTERLHEYAERTRAHRTPAAGLDTTTLTFGELHEALGSLRDVIGKYCTLLGHGMPERWEPVAQFPTIRPFTEPWVVDRDAVKRAIGEEPRRG